MKRYFVYILSNVRRTVLYIGVTNNLTRRFFEHLSSGLDHFASRYRCADLVYTEEYHDIIEAITREKQIKRWSRKKKIALMRYKNPKMYPVNIY